MKVFSGFIVCLVLLLYACADEKTERRQTRASDTIPAFIELMGSKIDTAYLDTYYRDPGGYAIDETESVELKATGRVNTSVPGTYYLDYDYIDAAGNNATTVTRTVQVVENSAGFLNGNYTVACSCTANIAGTSNATITATHYTAAVLPYPANNRFELVQLKISSEYVIPLSFLSGNTIHLEFYRNSDALASGTVSSSKNSFTIETQVYENPPMVTYKCKNIYTKKLVDIGAKK
jgi:hypothetical protein